MYHFELHRPHRVLIFLFACFMSSKVKSQGQFESDDEDCLKLLPDGYKKYQPPFPRGEPGNVVFRFSLLDLDEISEANMDMRIHGYFHAYWIDERLRPTKELLVNAKCAQHMWIPDLVFSSVKTIENFDNRNMVFAVNGTTIYSVKRYAFKNSCRMYFSDYPFDSQYCGLTMSMMSASDAIVTIKWQPENKGIKPIEVQGKIEPLQFYFLDPVADSDVRTIGLNQVNFTQLTVKLTLVRRLMGSIINTYLPSTLIVSVSWITFWIHLQATPARVSLSITSLLTLCTQVQQNKTQLPPLTYITAVDIWSFVCIFMVFATLVEFAICYNAYMDKEMKSSKPCERKDASASKINSWTSTENANGEEACDRSTAPPQLTVLGKCLARFSHTDTNQMDALCRKLFPGSFLIFSLSYWVYYLSKYNALID